MIDWMLFTNDRLNTVQLILGWEMVWAHHCILQALLKGIMFVSLASSIPMYANVCSLSATMSIIGVWHECPTSPTCLVKWTTELDRVPQVRACIGRGLETHSLVCKWFHYLCLPNIESLSKNKASNFLSELGCLWKGDVFGTGTPITLHFLFSGTGRCFRY